MSDGTDIEWTRTYHADGSFSKGATWNPVRGCDKISPGCKHCYAETFAERFRGVPGHPYEQGFDLRLAPGALAKPLTWRAPRHIFVNSMSDLFHDDVPNEYIAAVFGVMAACPQHTFQVLTKRAERMRRWFEWIRYRYGNDRMTPAEGCRWEAMQRIEHRRPDGSALPGPTNALFGYDTRWPLPNVQLGVSIESAPYLHRVDDLLATPAAVRFLSIEPLLGPVSLHPGTLGCIGHLAETFGNPLIHWVIVGGESGPGAREMKPEWVRSLRDQVTDAGAAFFFKQWGGVRKKLAGRLLDGRTWDEYPTAPRHRTRTTEGRDEP
jgi:protein gp37